MGLPLLVYSDPSDVNRRLVELGLEEILLTRPVQKGFSAWASCTGNHPPIFPGLYGWAETVCALREELIPRGWERSNEVNLPFVVNQEHSIAISVSTGDEDTGRKDGSPCTSAAKGPRTARAILENLGQGVLFESLPPAELVNAGGRATWILLMFRDMKTRELRCELSRPIRMAPEGYVDGWAERIILSATPFDEGALARGDVEGPQSPEIEVKITKRA
jgi:hypothetical protein